jgi:tetraacyldisaccharide 4'-kinase
MWRPQKFRELVSGRRRGLAPSAARAVLRLAEIPYTAAVRWRNSRYDAGRAAMHRVEVPVISVGNLTLGGTGKTPMVEWIARWLRQQGVHVCLISRGYGADNGASNDEALELAQKLPDVPHLLDPDRVRAARTAIRERACQTIVLDDGFQHRRLARDLDVVLLDALEPFGWGHVFPRGTLREPVAGIARAGAIALSRADAASPEERAAVRAAALRHAPEAVWMEVTHAPRSLLSASGREIAVESLASRPVAAVCGIGNPAGFWHTLERIGCKIVARREFPDHHRYRPDEIRSLGKWADGLGAEAVLTTHKDLVKIGVENLGRQPLWAVRIGLEFLAGQAQFEALLRRLLPAADENSG